jgi:hypothetical protein
MSLMQRVERAQQRLQAAREAAEREAAAKGLAPD